jgi:hypothetical protein
MWSAVQEEDNEIVTACAIKKSVDQIIPLALPCRDETTGMF